MCVCVCVGGGGGGGGGGMTLSVVHETRWLPFYNDIFKCVLFNENVSLSIKISLKFVPKGAMTNIPAMVQIMAWRQLGDKPLSEPMMVSLLTKICVTQSQWVRYMMLRQDENPMVSLQCVMKYRADSRFAPSQWETSLKSKKVSHWLGAFFSIYMMSRILRSEP